jgi:heptaprenyl diphosphate synthase
MHSEERDIKKIALLVSCAAVLQIAESLLPHPIPGIRLGLANMITLVALVNIGFRAAIEIAVFRTIISSFILGTFLSPAFFLSFSGSFISALVMGALLKLSTLNHKVYLSIIGISMMGAVTHNMVQISLVYFLLIQHRGVFLLLPWIGISSVLMGWITGLVAAQVCRKLRNPNERSLHLMDPEKESAFKPQHYRFQNTPIHRLSPVLKIISVVIFSVCIVFLKSFQWYSIFLLLLLVITGLAKIRLSSILLRLLKLSPVIVFSFLIPLFFINGGSVLFRLGPVEITQAGLETGALFGFRIILLMLTAFILIQTTSPETLTAGLGKILSPLHNIGVSEQRISKILLLSWSALPDLWGRIRQLIKNRRPEDKKLTKLIPVLSDIITTVYIQIDNNYPN